VVVASSRGGDDDSGDDDNDAPPRVQHASAGLVQADTTALQRTGQRMGDISSLARAADPERRAAAQHGSASYHRTAGVLLGFATAVLAGVLGVRRMLQGDATAAREASDAHRATAVDAGRYGEDLSLCDAGRSILFRSNGGGGTEAAQSRASYGAGPNHAYTPFEEL